MKYFIHDLDQGYVEFNEIEHAAEKFVKGKMKSQCSTLGIRQGSSTVDIIYKKMKAEEIIYSGSAEFLTSEMVETNSEDIINTVLLVHKLIKKISK